MMIRTQIQLTERQVAALKHVARDRRVSMAAVIRDAVDRVVEETDRRATVERAIAAIGGFAGGAGDIARDHDRYLDLADEG